MTDLTERLRVQELIKDLREIGRDGTWKQGCTDPHPVTLEAATTLETLTQEKEALRHKLWMVACHATGGGMRDIAGIDQSINDICVQISASRNLVWAEAQKHAAKDLAQENARLREAGWRDIESAPRDGTQFLALVSNGWYAIASAPAEALREGWPYQWWRTNDRQSYPVVETHSADSTFGMTLEYWMPLPPAPARKALGGGDE